MSRNESTLQLGDMRAGLVDCRHLPHLGKLGVDPAVVVGRVATRVVLLLPEELHRRRPARDLLVETQPAEVVHVLQQTNMLRGSTTAS